MEEPLAQLVEHLTFNQRVRGSNPLWLTICGCGGIGRRAQLRILAPYGVGVRLPFYAVRSSSAVDPTLPRLGSGAESRLLLHFYSAGVAELADAQDLNPAVSDHHTGSIPVLGAVSIKTYAPVAQLDRARLTRIKRLWVRLLWAH